MFGPSYSDIQGALDHQSATAVALVGLLIEKGVFTDEEWTAARAKSVAWVDQVQAQRRDEMRKEQQCGAFDFLNAIIKWPDGSTD